MCVTNAVCRPQPGITKRAKIILALADANAVERGANKVEMVDILLAILAHGRSVAAAALSDWNMAAKVPSRLLTPLDSREHSPNWRHDLRENGFLCNVAEETLQLGYRHSGPESLLLAMMTHPCQDVDDILLGVGADRESVRATVYEILGKSI
jgi:ATP-dependent Clp protease ATP-binding subunit ClpA